MNPRRVITGDPPPRSQGKLEPIHPQDINKLKNEAIPESVIAAFNHLLIKNWANTEAIIYKSYALKEILYRDASLTERIIYDNHWLDVENLYESYGWEVKYVNSSESENNEPYYLFTIP